jgi:biopolymer transport protein ExbD
MKLRRLKKSKKGRIEIIPMIDVMFFLLATFMLASLSMQRLNGLAVDLTRGAANQVNVENQITLSITHDNLIFLNKEPILLSELKSRLQSMLRGADKTVIITSDKHAFQGVVMQSMLAAREAGAEHFSIIARKE